MPSIGDLDRGHPLEACSVVLETAPLVRKQSPGMTLGQVSFGVAMGMAIVLYLFAVKGWLR